ncbi:MAG: hypothetical protein ACRDT0_05625 [Pseudonocardiaceae bacterium]
MPVVLLDLGGTIEVALAADYRQRKVTPGNAAQFDDLIDKATAVHTMPFEQSGGEAAPPTWSTRPTHAASGHRRVVARRRARLTRRPSRRAGGPAAPAHGRF